MRHYQELDWKGLYRARDGRILGVCKGLARFLDVPVTLVRLGMILLAVFTGFWPAAGLYLLAGFILKPEPALTPGNEAEREFYNSYASSRESGLRRVKRKFDRLEKRIRRIEDSVTSREYDWDRRFKSGDRS